MDQIVEEDMKSLIIREDKAIIVEQETIAKEVLHNSSVVNMTNRTIQAMKIII